MSDRTEVFMANVFTDYPKISEIPLEEAEISNIKKTRLIKAVKKLQRKLKKQKKIIHKLCEQKEESDRTSSKCNTNDEKMPTQDKEKKFLDRVKDKFIDAIPKICCTAVKTFITVAFGWAFKRFGVLKVA